MPMKIKGGQFHKVIAALIGAIVVAALLFGPKPVWAATFTVDSTADVDDAIPGDGVCATAGGDCTLRAAIQQANASGGTDTIAFSIPATDSGYNGTGNGEFTIQPTSKLPDITDPAILDGTTQPGFSGTPIIELDGSLSLGFPALSISAGMSSVRGLVINRFGNAGIELTTNGGNVIHGNYIGTDVTGTIALGNSAAGVDISGAPDNTIGGTTASQRNIISGNKYGIQIKGSNSTDNVIQGNFIGTDVSGTAALGNSHEGVRIQGIASSNTIGGTTVGQRNVISGNGRSGIVITAVGTTGNLVLGNYIGTDVSGTATLGNGWHGVQIADGASNNTIGGPGGAGNRIAFNVRDGVGILDQLSDGNAIRANAIFSNTGIGIDLDDDNVTLNEVGDLDTGANDQQNFPVLTSAGSSGGSTTITGTINSTPGTTFALDFFSSTATDPTGYGEGETYLGSDTVSTDGSGNAYFTTTLPTAVPLGAVVTATATDPSSNTSEYSATVTVMASVPTVTFTVASQSGAENVGTLTVTAQLSAVPSLDVTLPFTLGGTATDPADYTITASPLLIPAGATTADITITVNDDGFDEGDETVIVTMGVPTNATQGATTVHTATITDNDASPTVTFTAASQSGAEDVGTMTVTAQLSAVSGQDVSVPCTLSGTATDPADYTITASPLMIPAGSTSTDITITVNSDALNEADETIIVTMGVPINATKGAVDVHIATINDDDVVPTVSFTVASQGGQEHIGTMIVTAQLSAISGQDVTVPFSLGGTATEGAGTDYTITATPIVISAGSPSADITITVNDDALSEVAETIVVTMEMPINATQGATTEHTATITDNEGFPTVTFTSSRQSGPENVGSMTITAQLSAASGLDVTVPYTFGGTATEGAGSDYTITITPIVISAGTTTADITITVNDDGINEADETLIVAMGIPINATSGATTVHTATITDNDTVPTVTFTAANQSGAEDVGTMTVAAQLSAVAGQDVTVPYTLSGTATDPADYTITASPIIISAGTLSADITITVNDDGIDEADETVIVTMGAPTNATSGATIVHTASIADNDTAGVTITESGGSTDVTEGGATDTYTLVLETMPTADVTITMTSPTTDGQLSVSPSTLVFSPGDWDMPRTVTVTAVDDLVEEGVHTGTIIHSAASADGNYDGIGIADVITDITNNETNTLVLTKTANRKEAVVGDVVTYRVELKNTTLDDVLQVWVEDEIPPNFKYLMGSAQLSNLKITDPVGNRTLTFDIGTVAALLDGNNNGEADPGEPGHLSLSYQLVVGSGATPGDYVNTAVATNACDQCFISNRDEARVTVTLDPLFDLGTIIGKVFEDKNGDGWQDRYEAGVAGVMVVLDDGTYALTDEHGRYHFPAVRPGQRLLKINLQSLASGATTTMGVTRVVSVTPGLLAKANFGVVYRYDSETIGKPGETGLMMVGEGYKKPIEVLGSVESLTVLINGEKVSLPNNSLHMSMENLDEIVEIEGQSLKKPVEFQVEIESPTEVKDWHLTIMDAGGISVCTLHGLDMPPRPIRWDGRTDQGPLVSGGEIYQYQMETRYADGSLSTSARRLFGIDRTSAISLALTGSAFVSNVAELSPQAEAALKEVAEVLRKHPDEKVVIEGHTDWVGTEEHNLKLSQQRAETARAYLVEQERIPADRFVLRWHGESRPIASNGTDEGRELNRRVEINGEYKAVERSKLIDQYRARPMVKINGVPVNVEQDGRFTAPVEEEKTSRLELEIGNEQGGSLKTTLPVPLFEIFEPRGEMRLARGVAGGTYVIMAPPGREELDPADTAVLYRLVGRTEPGNTVELDGKQLEVTPDGTFTDYLELKPGKTPYAILVRNPAGCTRIGGLNVTVSDRDEDGHLIMMSEPVPNLTVKLPPKGDLLASPRYVVSGVSDPGNAVLVNGQPVPVQPDGHFVTTIELPDGKSMIRVQAIDPAGHVGAIEREVELNDTRLFFLAFADGKVSQLKGKGYLQGAGMTDSTEIVTEGRLALYLKGVIAGEYLITAAFDSESREFDELFKDLDASETDRLLTNLDPDNFYPVYGDSSSTAYDTESQGKLYLALDSKEFHLLVGNYPLNLDDTELATYQRTLYGGHLDYASASRTRYDQPDTKVELFGAEVRQVHVRDELNSTGGSLYFLSQDDVIEGSDQVTLVVRDKDTGLQLARLPQQQNVDYSIKYEEGRILFNRPITSVQSDDRLVDRNILPGNPVFIQVDYETRADTFEKTTAGGHVRQQLGDHIAVGVTYVEDELSTDRYTLQGVDTEVRLGKNTRLVAEYAESRGTDSTTFVSEDGGLSYQETTSDGSNEGSAWKVAAEVDAGEWFGSPDRVQLGGYIKRLQSGFASSGNFREQGSEKTGGHARLQITEADKLLARYDREKLDTADQTALGRSDTGTVQWVHDQGRWGLTGEYQHRETEDAAGSRIDRSDLAAAQLRVDLTEKVSSYLEHQQTLSGADNDQSTLGVEYQANSILALHASGTEGSLGRSAQGGASLKLGQGHLYLTQRLAEEQAGRVTSTILGGEAPVGEHSKVYSEYQWEHSEQGYRNVSLLGAQRHWDVTDGLQLLLSGEYSDIDAEPSGTSRYTVAAGFSYSPMAGLKFTTRNEVRREQGDVERVQYLTTNHLELKLNPDFTLLGKYRYSVTRDRDLNETEARFDEASMGLAYRPVAHDHFNALARYTHLTDQRPLSLDEIEAEKTTTDVASIEWSLQFNRYLEWVEKEAVKRKEETIGNSPSVETLTWLSLHRLNFNLWRAIDLGLEYRMLKQKEADDQRQGWLVEPTWQVNDHFRAGIGYNFTDFSDDEFSDNDYSVSGWFMRIQGIY